MRLPLLRVAVALVTFTAGISAAGVRALFGGLDAAEAPDPRFVSESAAARAADPEAEEEIREIMRRYAEAQTRRDVSFFEQAEADTYTVTMRDGSVINRAQAIAEMLGEREATSYVHEDLRVEFFGEAAVVTGWMKATASRGGTPYHWRWKSIYLFARRQGRWQILSVTQVN